ncbi:MAG: hypothetical protein MJ025_06165, partial [Victivallaceae bacterium]|nr:hypothetical protein [Victivallaceae bacterium]
MMDINDEKYFDSSMIASLQDGRQDWHVADYNEDEKVFAVMISPDKKVKMVTIDGVTYYGKPYDAIELAFYPTDYTNVTVVEGGTSWSFVSGLTAGRLLVVDHAGFSQNSYHAAVDNDGGTALFYSSIMSNNAVRGDGGAICNKNNGTVRITDTVFTGNEATHGGAIYNAGGSVEIRNCAFATSTDTGYNRGSVTLGGTITTAANITSTNAITIESGTKLVLDLSVSVGGGGALLTDYQRMFGDSQVNLTIAINVAGGQGRGTYVLATKADNFDRSKVISVMSGGAEIGKFQLSGGSATIVGGDNLYSLAIDGGSLVLEVTSSSTVGVVTAAGTSGTVVINGVTYTGEPYAQDKIGKAFTYREVVAAQNVTLSGFTVAAGKTFVGENITMSGTTATVYNAGAMSLSGTITARANISSTNAITVAENTKLALDLSGYAGTMSGELLTDFGTMFGNSQSNLTISINVGSNQAEGTYVLATGAGGLNQKSFTVTVGGDKTKAFTVSVNGFTEYGPRFYTLQLADGMLSLVVEKREHVTGIVTATGTVGTVVIGGITYSGNPYGQGQIDQALAREKIVAAQGVTLSGFTVAADRQFVGGDIAMSGTAATIYNAGTMSLAGTITTGANITSDNAISVASDTRLVLDLSVYGETMPMELLTNFNTMFGVSQSNLTISLHVDESQKEGRYVLATGAGTLAQQSFTVTLDGNGQGSITLAVNGDVVSYKHRNYSLGLVDGVLSLQVDGTGIVTQDGDTDTVVIDGVTYMGDTYRQEQIGKALSEKKVVVAQDVTALPGFVVNEAQKFIGDRISKSGGIGESGGAFTNAGGTSSITYSVFTGNTANGTGGAIEIARKVIVGTMPAVQEISHSTFTRNYSAKAGGAIASKTFCTTTIWGSTFTGNTSGVSFGAVYNGGTMKVSSSVFDGNVGNAFYNTGTATLRDCSFTTETDRIYNENGMLTLGGNIWTAANFSSTKSVSVEKYTRLTLDISVYGKTTSRELLTNFDTMFGTTQGNLTISINVGTDQEYGRYVLATGVGELNQKSFIVNLGTEAVFAVTVDGESFHYGDKYYSLRLAEGTLAFGVSTLDDCGIVTERGDADTVVIDGTVYIGKPYKQDQIGEALAERKSVVAQRVSYGGERLTIGKVQTFIAEAISISGSMGEDSGALRNDGGMVGISGSTFTCNTAYFGGAMYVLDGSATISGSTFGGNVAALYGGAIYNEQGSLTISSSTFADNAAGTFGGAVYSGLGGKTTIRNSVFSTKSDTIYNAGDMKFGGTIRTAANITSDNAISVDIGTRLVLDLSVYAGTTSKELLTGFDTMFGSSQSSLTLSINVASEQDVGEYVLATGAGTLAQTDFTITVDGDARRSFTVFLNAMTEYDSRYYFLSFADGTLMLDVDTLSTGIVTKLGTADTVVIDGVTYTGRAYGQGEIDQALAMKKIVAAQDVSCTGTRLTVDANKTFVASTISMSGNAGAYDGGAICNSGTMSVTAGTFSGNSADKGGAVYNTGTATLRDSVFATETDTIYNDGGAMTIGGAIWTAANITSDKSITVEKNTELMLDFSVYGETTSRELLTGFDTMFGDSQGNLAISINVADDQEERTYVLATGVGELNQQSFTVTLDGDATRSFTVTVGTIERYDGKDYLLELFDGVLSLDIGSLEDTGIVTGDGTARAIVISGEVYFGKSYKQEQFHQALVDRPTVAAQDVDLARFEVASGKTLAGDKIRMSGNSNGYGGAIKNIQGAISVTGSTFSDNSATYGGAISNEQGAISVTGSTFSGNSASDGGAIFNNQGTISITGSTFSGNSASDGGAICNNQGTISITGSSFFGNSASSGGAIYNKQGTISITGCIFFGNSALYGGAVERSSDDGETTITGSTFTGNSAHSGGAIENDCTVAITDSIFTGNSAGTDGGAIENDCTADITDSIFTDNSAGADGGAIYNTGTATISDSTFSNNSAGGYGGAICNSGTATISDSVFATETDTI